MTKYSKCKQLTWITIEKIFCQKKIEIRSNSTYVNIFCVLLIGKTGFVNKFFC